MLVAVCAGVAWARLQQQPMGNIACPAHNQLLYGWRLLKSRGTVGHWAPVWLQLSSSSVSVESNCTHAVRACMC